MEKCLPFKSFTGALFFLALLFIMYDPPEIHSQCVDVSSSPCYVNISDIPYEMFQGTMYSSRNKIFYDSIWNELVYVDTCNQEWKKNEGKLLYKYFYFWFDKEHFMGNLKEGDFITVNEIKDDFQDLKDIFIEFELRFCKFKFEILFLDDFFLKLILDKNALLIDVDEFWRNKDTNYLYYNYHSGKMIPDPSTSYNQNETLEKFKISNNSNNLSILNNNLLYDEEITIYDYLGLKQIETTIKSNVTNIDISTLSRGIYFVEIKNKIYKFMKE